MLALNHHYVDKNQMMIWFLLLLLLVWVYSLLILMLVIIDFNIHTISADRRLDCTVGTVSENISTQKEQNT